MSTPGSPQRERLLRILERLIERTNTDALAWERAAPPESWAVNVGQTRFRIYPEPGEQPSYILDVMGPVGDSVRSEDAETAERLASLYQAANANGKRHTPDPFAEVEAALGLGNGAGSDEPAASPRGAR